MEYNFINVGKKAVSLVVIISFVLTNFLPVFTPKAEAFLGIGDVTFTINVKEIVRNIIDGIAMNLAQKMVDDMVQSSVTWASSGFEGSPSFVQDPGDHFKKIADGVAGDFIKGSDLGFLCSPFQNSIRLSLQVQYKNTAGGGAYRPQCTLTGVSNNLEGFYKNFTVGGWDTWFDVLQNDSNNPYGAYIGAQQELDSRLASKLGIEDKKLGWGQGFKSKGDCLLTNPSRDEIEQWMKDNDGQKHPQYNAAYDPGACVKFGPDKTPGAVIKGQLDKVLPAGLEKLISVQHVEQLVTAFASGVLKRYVFSSKGLAGNDYSGEVFDKQNKDIDGDSIFDGSDEDGDGQIDSCYHGLINKSEIPSNTNCQGSKTAVNSPYFIPICQDTERTTKALQVYLDFAIKNNFKKEYVNTWMNRTLLVGDSVDRLEGTLTRYENMDYDPAIFRLGKYTKYTGKLVQSLAKDEDIKDRGFIDYDFGGGSRSNSAEQDILIRNTEKLLNYLKQIRSVIGQCDKPNSDAIEKLPPPDIGDRPEIVPEDGWILCADEGDYCTFSDTREVRYGTNSTYTTQTFTDSTLCTNETFGGDPYPDVIKWCVYKSDASTDPVAPTNPPSPETPPSGPPSENTPI